MPATPASPPPPGSGSFTLTPRQAQSDATGEPKRDQEEGAGPSDGTLWDYQPPHIDLFFCIQDLWAAP